MLCVVLCGVCWGSHGEERPVPLPGGAVDRPQGVGASALPGTLVVVRMHVRWPGVFALCLKSPCIVGCDVAHSSVIATQESGV